MALLLVAAGEASARTVTEPSVAMPRQRVVVTTSFVRVTPIRFATSSAALSPEAVQMLDQVATALRANSHRRFIVEGHTDATGSSSQNAALSLRRAQVVASYLIARGVPSRQLMVVGKGARDPVASNRSPRGRKLNRRVVLRLV